MKSKMTTFKSVLVAFMAILLCFACISLSACGKKIEEGEYTGTVTYETDYDATHKYGVKVTIYVDSDGIIWTIDASAPDDTHAFTNQFTWTVSGSKFTQQFLGNWTVAEFAKIEVGLDETGFPLQPGDGSKINHPTKDVMSLHDAEATCGVVILCIQQIIADNNLA
jgi:hypothetical protein